MNRSRSISALLILTIVSVVFIYLYANGYFGVWRDKLTDLLFTEKPQSSDIVIVGIDEASINKIGQWPWPRAVFGNILSRLTSAKAVGIDVNFNEVSGRGTADDDSFAKAIFRSTFPIILSSKIDGKKEILPIEKLNRITQSGYTNVLTAPDGVIRRVKILDRDTESFSLKLALTLVEKLGPELSSAITSPVRISYLGRNGFPFFSFNDVLSGKIPVEFFKAKIVLIGATATDLHDYFLTPVGNMAGVKVQASALQTILSGTILKTNTSVDWAAIILMAFLSVLLPFSIKKLWLLILAVFSALAVYNIGVFIFFDRMLVVDMFYPNLALIVGSITSVAFQYMAARKERKFIQDSFSRYLAPEIVSRLVENPSLLKLGGEKKELTIMFSDIRGFTSLSEKMNPEELSRFLNAYLTRMTDTILGQHGLVDKYIGDAIMAFWGAPLDNPDQTDNAISAALEMMEALQLFNKKNADRGLKLIDIGIGLNAGEVTVGNMGSEKRFDYTVIGDNVNLASRLEGLNKIYGTNIVASQSAIKKMKNKEILFREIDRVRVKGKNEPVTIFEIVPEYRRASVAPILDVFNVGLADYYRGNWEGAIKSFEKVIKKLPNDGPTGLLNKRCYELKNRSFTSTGEWRGIWEMAEK